MNMLPDSLNLQLMEKIAKSSHPRELVVDVLFAMQNHYGWLPDEAIREASGILGMTPMEIEELATFYTFLFREPVGKYVIHVCDSLVCEMNGYPTLLGHLKKILGIDSGETTSDGLFTLLPVCCIGYCDRSPAILVNKKVFGPLTPEKLNAIIDNLRKEAVT